MSIISVPNLKEIKTWEGYFYATNIFVILCEEENVKKIRHFLGTNISRSAEAISICEVVYMYGRKYINLVEIGLVVLEIWKVPVNNTLVCRTSSFAFLAADTLLYVLITHLCATHLLLFSWLLTHYCMSCNIATMTYNKV